MRGSMEADQILKDTAMPLYEYECQQCHKHTEKRQKFSDPEITECPHCGGKLQRVLSAPAFSFAGGGWYKDLYSSNKPAAAKESSESSGKSESKPASSDTPSTSSPAPAPAAPAPASSPSPAKK